MKTNECDVLIAIGMRFDDRVTGNLNTYAKQAKVIHLDIDASELNKNVATTVPLLGNVKEVLPKLTEKVQPNNHSEWIDSFAVYEEREKNEVISKELMPQSGNLKMGEVVAAVSEAVNHDAVLVTDVGQNQMMAARYFKFRRSRSVVTSGGLGTMGFGLPAAIGAKVACPNRTVCFFVGDGGIQMTIQELGTIMQEQTGVKIILMNNNWLGMVRQWQELFYESNYSQTQLVNPDFSLIAKAYGIASRQVSERSELKDAINDMLKDDAPYMLIVNVEPEGLVFPMTPAGHTITDIMTGEKA